MNIRTHGHQPLKNKNSDSKLSSFCPYDMGMASSQTLKSARSTGLHSYIEYPTAGPIVLHQSWISTANVKDTFLQTNHVSQKTKLIFTPSKFSVSQRRSSFSCMW